VPTDAGGRSPAPASGGVVGLGDGPAFRRVTRGDATPFEENAPETWLRRLLGAQLAIADIVFVVYAWAGKNWELDSSVIDIWLGATVVQVVGVVLVVTRHLFPQRDRHGCVATQMDDL
jgi:hypothetical protein